MKEPIDPKHCNRIRCVESGQAVVMNRTNAELPYVVRHRGELADSSTPAHGIQ